MELECTAPYVSTPNVPHRLHVVYRVGSYAWYVKDDATKAFHLRAPSISSVLSECGEVITRKGILTPGQIVATSGVKLVDPEKENVLIVTIAPVWSECVEDTGSLESKLMEWYVQKSQIEGREPTRSAFKRLLRNLKQKASENE